MKPYYEKNPHRFKYEWYLKNGYPAPGIEKNNLKVFSCFACGGGSTMGYKLAGYDVIGFNEIDPKMAECYIENHNPKYKYIEPIQEFKNRNDLPEELYNLDILDGSPPCSSFSMAGNREKDWGKKKKFREGQQEQVLDTLFFDFLDVAEKLQPKVIVAENVKGLLMGNVTEFLAKVMNRFETAGYIVGRKLLNASKMGVPQRRERVFFYAIRKDLKKHIKTCDLFGNEPALDLCFNEKEILFKEFADYDGKNISEYALKAWSSRKVGDKSIADSKARCGMKVSDMSTFYVYDEKVCATLTSKGDCGSLLFSKPIRLSINEFCKIGSYPLDYNFINKKQFGYMIGMSVPPIIAAQIATRIREQWFDKIISKSIDT